MSLKRQEMNECGELESRESASRLECIPPLTSVSSPFVPHGQRLMDQRRTRPPLLLSSTIRCLQQVRGEAELRAAEPLGVGAGTTAQAVREPLNAFHASIPRYQGVTVGTFNEEEDEMRNGEEVLGLVEVHEEESEEEEEDEVEGEEFEIEDDEGSELASPSISLRYCDMSPQSDFGSRLQLEHSRTSAILPAFLLSRESCLASVSASRGEATARRDKWLAATCEESNVALAADVETLKAMGICAGSLVSEAQENKATGIMPIATWP